MILSPPKEGVTSSVKYNPLRGSQKIMVKLIKLDHSIHLLNSKKKSAVNKWIRKGDPEKL